jgi:hypothetical protein
MKTLTITAAKKNLGRLLSAAAKGEESELFADLYLVPLIHCFINVINAEMEMLGL